MEELLEKILSLILPLLIISQVIKKLSGSAKKATTQNSVEKNNSDKYQKPVKNKKEYLQEFVDQIENKLQNNNESPFNYESSEGKSLWNFDNPDISQAEGQSIIEQSLEGKSIESSQPNIQGTEGNDYSQRHVSIDFENIDNAILERENNTKSYGKMEHEIEEILPKHWTKNETVKAFVMSEIFTRPNF